jgi:acid stress-induced BolA-like protein IbaG/YrbA
VHFDAEIKAAQFAGLSRVAMQQQVYAALGDLITSGAVHALSLKTLVKE